MNDLLSEAAHGDSLSFEGVVTRRRAIPRTDGVKAVLSVAGHGVVCCVWWSGGQAPREGSAVAVTGTVSRFRGHNELRVDRTIPASAPTLEEGWEPRLLQYWSDCLEAEDVSQLVLPVDGRSHVTIDKGHEPAITVAADHPVPLPVHERVDQWCLQRQMAGRADAPYGGWPIVTGMRPVKEGDRQRVLAPLFFAPITVRREERGLWTALATARAEVNAYALELLGLGREERDETVDALENLDGLDGADPHARASLRIGFLIDNGILPADTDFDPTHLEPLQTGTNRPPSNSAVLFVARGVGYTRSLLRELDELAAQTRDSLRQGPLGALLGAVGAPRPPLPSPQPSVLPTTLAQDRAVTSALKNVLTVVTGPPGTGKSQVLVNTVAAAVADGQSVLFASKNNHAVDVVFERIRAVTEEAVPLRAGPAKLRCVVAGSISSALARERRSTPDLTAARAEWQRQATAVAGIYEQFCDRIATEDRLHEAERQADLAGRRADPKLLAAVATEDVELVETAFQAAHTAAVALDRRWRFWQRRRHRRAQLRATETLATLLRWAPPGAQLGRDGPDGALAAFRAVLDVHRATQTVDAARNALAALPTAQDLNDELDSHANSRVTVGRRLFDACWTQRLRDPTYRSTASAYAHALEKVADGAGRGARSLLQQVPAVIAVFPTWGITNLSARTFLPLRRELFDLVVIDEASQCDIPSAVPLLWRARRAFVIGDPHQLTHITSLSSARDEALAARHTLDDTTHARFGYVTHSLYTAAETAVAGAPIFLDRHYRSHPDIIEFSNREVYGGQLQVRTDPRGFLDGPAVEWRDVTGEFRRGPTGSSAVNEPEANSVVRVVAELHAVLGTGVSIGVVTPFRAQVELSRRFLAARLPDGYQDVVVDTAHGFQGDEGDVIVFSPVVSADMPAATARWAGNRHLVNVALTRARLRLVIIGDHDACTTAPGLIGRLALWCEERGFVHRP